jgi:hypothetical protein
MVRSRPHESCRSQETVSTDASALVSEEEGWWP